ncbi:MAG: AAA family ATPase [Phycisphaera sp.]|nr:AAA family ATPase [Phycisphaera sp.]
MTIEAGQTHAGIQRDDDMLADLTEPQREAVTHVEGPLLVLAGPGSGKTRVITRRIAYLVKGVGIAPWNILAITFTNKAAGEMRERVGRSLSERQARATTVMTFHSFCARILRDYADLVGLKPTFTIYDTADQQRAMKRALEDLDFSSNNFPPARVLATISNAKNELIDAEAFAAAASGFFDKKVAQLFSKYQSILRASNAVDFDDLLLLCVRLLREQTDVTEALRDRYQYLLIDEYQDTNHAQFVLAHALASGRARPNICATGDPDQSIYAWRGADIRNILDFETHYPDAAIVKLEQNYRSTQRILDTADALIQRNRQRKHKRLWTENEQGDKPLVVTCADERDEARWVVEHLTLLHDRQAIPWSGMAVFYRVNSLSRSLEEAFRAAAVPYQIARGTAFYDRKEVKDLIAYLRVLANPSDEVNLLRIINTPARGISDNTVKAMQAYATAHQLPLADVLDDVRPVTALNARAVSAVQKFNAQLLGWRRDAGLIENQPSPTHDTTPSLRMFVERVLRESGLEDYYRNDKGDPDSERLANLGELITSVQQYESDADAQAQLDEQPQPGVNNKLLGYLEQVSLVSDVDSLEGDPARATDGMVTLMTLHAAKGLEYPAVVIVGFEDGLIPHQRSRDNEKELEEERRLLFVGITRAMRRLSITRARRRTIFGQTQPTIRSAFLNELPSEGIETEDSGGEESDPFDRLDATGLASEFPPGTNVRHPQFGLGRVVNIATSGLQTRAKVHFNTVGSKTLILEYARLQRVEF